MKWCKVYKRILFIGHHQDEFTRGTREKEDFFFWEVFFFWMVVPEDFFGMLNAYSLCPIDNDGNIAGLCADWLSDHADFLREMNKEFPVAYEIIPLMATIFGEIFKCGNSCNLPKLPEFY